MWTLAYRDHQDRTPTHGYEATREAAMNAFRQVVAARELAAPGSASPLRLRGKPEPEKFPRYLLITGAMVEPLDHVAE
jgi:hypothetical protein